MLCRFFCNIGLLWFPGKKSCIIKVKDKELKIHRYWLPGRLLCSIRSNRKWCKRRGSSLECQNCFFVYPIIDSNLTNLGLSCFALFICSSNSSIPSKAYPSILIGMITSSAATRALITDMFISGGQSMIQ